MKLETVKALFTVAGIPVLRTWELPNGYWPHPQLEEGRESDYLRYARLRDASPWWLVKTAHGLVEIGWRKRVISIDWSDTGVSADVTADPVTKGAYMVHADDELTAAQYLAALGAALALAPAASPAEPPKGGGR